MLYTQLIQTGSVLLLLPFSTVLGFTLHKDTANGRAATHQLYSFAIEIGFAPMTGGGGEGCLDPWEDEELSFCFLYFMNITNKL